MKRSYARDMCIFMVTLFAIAMVSYVSVSIGTDNVTVILGFVGGCTALLFASLKELQQQVLGKLEEITEELRKERRDDDDRDRATSD